MEVVAPLISNEKQMKNIVTSMTTLLSASTLPVSVSMSSSGFYVSSGGTRYDDSVVRELSVSTLPVGVSMSCHHQDFM